MRASGCPKFFVLMLIAELQEGKSGLDNTFHISVFSTSAKNPLVKADHIQSPKLRGRKEYSIPSGRNCTVTGDNAKTQGQQKNWKK
jgi:hypothetical protein